MTFITWVMLGCILMVINLRDRKFVEVTEKKYPDFEKDMLSKGFEPLSYDTFYKSMLTLVLIKYALFWPAVIAMMLVKIASGEKK